MSNSFTPVLNFGGSDTGITYTVQTGTYELDGDKMFFNFQITVDDIGTETGAATIVLPLEMDAPTADFQLGELSAWGFAVGSFGVNINGNMAANTREIVLLYSALTFGTDPLVDSWFHSGSTLIFSGFYFV